MSGHSKWSQIKHKKGVTDAKRGNLFSKLSREITVAAKTGGPNPDFNARLRTAAERARQAGMPKENIERAIQRVAGGENDQGLQEFLYEVSGPEGIAILIEGITDNRNRTLAEIKRILIAHRAKLADPGSQIWNFEKIGVIEFETQDSPGKTGNELEELIIYAGAKDFQNNEDSWRVETDLSDLEKVRKNLEESGLRLKEIYHDYKPLNPVLVSPAAKTDLLGLLEELGGQDDTQEIYTNLKTE